MLCLATTTPMKGDAMRRARVLIHRFLNAAKGIDGRARLRRWVRERDAAAKKMPIRRGKYLYASPVGASGEAQLRKLLETFDADHFDFLIFVYDGHRFEGPPFDRCTFIHEKGVIYQFFKKYLTPEVAARYDAIFIGMEDIEVEGFSWRNFVDVMARNRLDVAAPALSAQSTSPYKLMFRHPGEVGRLVDVIEVFLAAFDARAWPRFWELIEPDFNHWGWGYVQLLQYGCGFKMGIVDCETISVLRPPNYRQESADGMKALFAKHRHTRRANFISYGLLD